MSCTPRPAPGRTFRVAIVALVAAASSACGLAQSAAFAVAASQGADLPHGVTMPERDPPVRGLVLWQGGRPIYRSGDAALEMVTGSAILDLSVAFQDSLGREILYEDDEFLVVRVQPRGRLEFRQPSPGEMGGALVAREPGMAEVAFSLHAPLRHGEGDYSLATMRVPVTVRRR